MKATGILFLLPTLIARDTVNDTLPANVINAINKLNEFIVEDERTSRRFLKKIGYTKTIDSVIFHTLNKHTDNYDIPSFLNSLLKGIDIGLLPEAGCPCIADPGSEIVKLAHQNKIRVRPLVGPSSILLALIASGFNGQNFAFNGYLPIDKNARIRKIKELENKAIREGQTQIFMETPYRNIQLFNNIIKYCRPETYLSISVDLTGEDEFILTMTIKEWNKNVPDINKKTAIFLLYI